jgi:mannose-6-phosphate isomerase-like protein (cupin superfamily)
MTRTNKETAATRQSVPISTHSRSWSRRAGRTPFGYKGEMTDATNLNRKLDLFDEHWQPKIVAQVNDYDVRIVKVKGEFVWHKHDHTDDFFLVLKGHLTIQLRDRNVELDEGELYVVPKGVEHCPRAEEEASVLLIEPSDTVNTGDAGGPLTAEPERI